MGYPKDACSEEEAFAEETDDPIVAEQSKHNFIHKCYLDKVDLTDEVESGVARFSVQKYRSVGDFEMRYFLGDSRNGQGYECRALREGVPDVYLHCVLRAAAISETITVVPASTFSHSNDHNSLSGGITGLQTFCVGEICSTM